MGEDELEAMQTAMSDMEISGLDTSILNDSVYTNMVISATGTDNQLNISLDGTITTKDRSVNIFELLDRLDKLEEMVNILTNSIPKKLTTRIIQNKNKIV